MEDPDLHPFRAVLTDFGLVKLTDSNVPMTRSGTTLGTPIYMSPEQCEGAVLDGRTDLYSLGVVLYELVTNRLPFRFQIPDATRSTPTCAATCRRRRATLRADVPQLIESLLTRLLAKRPEDRFPNGNALARALRSASFALENRPTRVMSLEETEDALQTGSRRAARTAFVCASPRRGMRQAMSRSIAR